MKFRRSFILAGTLLSMISASSAENVVNLYTARHYDSDEQLYARFEEKTGIKVNVIQGKADPLLKRIRQEGDSSPADVFVTVDAGRLWRAEDIFAATSIPTLSEVVPSEYRHPDGKWYGLSKRFRVLVYSNERFKSAPVKTYEELADPKKNLKVLVRTSGNIYNQSLVGSLIAHHGKEATLNWVKGLVNNMARDPEGNDTAQIKAVAAGLGDVAIANHYYVARLKAKKDPIGARVNVVFPNQEGRGAHVNISGAGIVKTAPHKENAVKLLEFLVSKEAQEVIAKGNHESPIRDDVAIPETLKAFGSFKQDTLSVHKLGENQTDAVKLMNEGGWQ